MIDEAIDETSEDKAECGMVVIRGTSIVMLEALEKL